MLKKIKNGLTYECFFTQTEVVCGVYAQNPHDVNHEIRCGIQDFLLQQSDNAQRTQSIIIDYFGKEKLEALIIELKQLNK